MRFFTRGTSPFFLALLVLTVSFSSSIPVLNHASPGASVRAAAVYKVYLPTLSLAILEKEWPTVAGNSERTSWVSDEINGNQVVAWYRPIEAYIPQNAQLIAADGLIFVPSSRGLYALNAKSGAIAWRFDTELPIGNSPTVVDNVVYVAGFDRKLHALDSLTGKHLWSFDGASAGYDANPLVVEGKVILGNRDGYLYAIGAHGTQQQGQLLWKFKTGGAIRLSAAYKNGVVVFASNDMFAYGVSTEGTQVWKSSQKQPGDGSQSYWPVVFTDPLTKRTLVVFSAGSGYRYNAGPGTKSVLCKSYFPNDPELYPCDNDRFSSDDFFYDVTSPDTPMGRTVAINEPWAQGKTVMDYSRLTEYFENSPQAHPHLHKPWRRNYIILDTKTGQEFTFDSDNDGNPEYVPVVPYMTNSGNPYPPIAGLDGLLYFNNYYSKDGQGRITGWRVGTKYMTIGRGAGDTVEPQAISGAGNRIYRNLCCDRVGDYFDIRNPADNGALWHYTPALSDMAPKYDQMWWFDDPTILARISGNYGTVNGIYHSHGDQNPIVPYQGMHFVHRSNAVIAFGPKAGAGKLTLLTSANVSDSAGNLSDAVLRARLTDEVRKIINAGHLRPGYYNAGQFDVYEEFINYFENPGDTLYSLAQAYPYTSADLQPQLKAYLKSVFNQYFDPVMYANIGWSEGVGREAIVLPPEVQVDLANYPKTDWPGYGWTWSYPQYNFYAMWEYAKIFPEDSLRIYNLAKSKLQVPVPPSATTDHFKAEPWEHNGYIAGYIGFLNLQVMAGKTVDDGGLRASVNNELNRLLQLKVSIFSKDTPYTQFSQGYNKRTMNVARNFLFLVPELGDYLNKNGLSKVQAAVDEYNRVGPYWFVTRYPASIAESAMQNLYDVPAMYQAKALILKEPREELTKYLDVPAFERGDLYYIQNLIVSIEAAPTLTIVPVTSIRPNRQAERERLLAHKLKQFDP